MAAEIVDPMERSDPTPSRVLPRSREKSALGAARHGEHFLRGVDCKPIMNRFSLPKHPLDMDSTPPPHVEHTPRDAWKPDGYDTTMGAVDQDLYGQRGGADLSCPWSRKLIRQKAAAENYLEAL